MDVQPFLDSFIPRLAAADLAHNQAWWEANTSGDPAAVERVREAREARMALFTDPNDWARLTAWRAFSAIIPTADLKRQAEVLYLEFARNQRTPEQIAEVAALETELQAIFASFRATVDGEELNENQLGERLMTATDSAVAQTAWEASKQIGAVVAPRLLELVRLRNTIAREQGYPDYYTQQLQLQEIEPEALQAVLDEIEQATTAPFVAQKAALDAHLAQRFGIEVAALRPWHYNDPFFQNPPRLGDYDFDALYHDQDLEGLALRSFASQGMEVGDLLEASDLYERPGKNQHGYCIRIDRETDDVRMLCNLRPTARWMDTLLHELGHAIYYKFMPNTLPYLLRNYPHTSTTEAIAMLMGRQARNGVWLTAIRGLDAAAAEEAQRVAREEQRFGMLLFARWVLVMSHFERTLYADPDRADLNQVWWELVERFQLLQRPDERDAPDWAAKLHLALAPVYYHNYLLGEMTASQLEQHIATNLAGDGVVANAAVGPFLADKLFALGARFAWNDTVREVTGEPLSARAFVEQYVD